MNDYKKVNLNLIMLNMALIVDSDHEFNWELSNNYMNDWMIVFIFYIIVVRREII